MSPSLSIRNLKVHYATDHGIVRAVDDVSFELEAGTALGLVGESGSGKSTLALAIMRLLPRNIALYEGSVFMDDVDIMGLSDERFRQEVRWRRMSMVFQGAMDSFNPVIKIGPQILEPLLVQTKIRRKEAMDRALGLMQKVQLPGEVLDRYPHELSGGMKQRALIAMALIMNSQWIILDEPTSALDVSVQAQIMNLLKSLKREMGLSFIFITHDIALASDLCDIVGVMYAGELVEMGPADEVIPRPRHPYTEKLLASVPRLKSEAIPEFIPGMPPDMIHPPTGCRFHPRCPYVFEPCYEKAPDAFAVGSSHYARCWLRKDSHE